jgi:hypothetical protein
MALRMEDVLLPTAAREAEREERRDGDRPDAATWLLHGRALLITLRRARLPCS